MNENFKIRKKEKNHSALSKKSVKFVSWCLLFWCTGELITKIKNELDFRNIIYKNLVQKIEFGKNRRKKLINFYEIIFPFLVTCITFRLLKFALS